MITKEEVLDVQKQWSGGLLKIVEKHQNNEDFTSEASGFIDELYAYSYGEVLFKPTLATDVQFRLNKAAALSYFVAGNPGFSEDKGFALKGWTVKLFFPVKIGLMLSFPLVSINISAN